MSDLKKFLASKRKKKVEKQCPEDVEVEVVAPVSVSTEGIVGVAPTPVEAVSAAASGAYTGEWLIDEDSFDNVEPVVYSLEGKQQQEATNLEKATVKEWAGWNTEDTVVDIPDDQRFIPGTGGLPAPLPDEVKKFSEVVNTEKIGIAPDYKYTGSMDGLHNDDHSKFQAFMVSLTKTKLDGLNREVINVLEASHVKHYKELAPRISQAH